MIRPIIVSALVAILVVSTAEARIGGRRLDIACGDGFTLGPATDTAPGECVDVDECATDDLNTCASPDACVNTQGSFACVEADGCHQPTSDAICQANFFTPGRHGAAEPNAAVILNDKTVRHRWLIHDALTCTLGDAPPAKAYCPCTCHAILQSPVVQLYFNDPDLECGPAGGGDPSGSATTENGGESNNNNGHSIEFTDEQIEACPALAANDCHTCTEPPASCEAATEMVGVGGCAAACPACFTAVHFSLICDVADDNNSDGGGSNSGPTIEFTDEQIEACPALVANDCHTCTEPPTSCEAATEMIGVGGCAAACPACFTAVHFSLICDADSWSGFGGTDDNGSNTDSATDDTGGSTDAGTTTDNQTNPPVDNAHCPVGFAPLAGWDGPDGTAPCNDVDECAAEDLNVCATPTDSCINIEGGYVCQTPTGTGYGGHACTHGTGPTSYAHTPGDQAGCKGLLFYTYDLPGMYLDMWAGDHIPYAGKLCCFPDP